MSSLTVDAVLLGSSLTLSWFLYSRWKKTQMARVKNETLTGGLPDPEPLHGFNLVRPDHFFTHTLHTYDIRRLRLLGITYTLTSLFESHTIRWAINLNMQYPIILFLRSDNGPSTYAYQ